MLKSLLRIGTLTAVSAVLGGCAQYQYTLTAPPQQQIVSEKQAAVVRAEPLEYAFLALDDHLSVRVTNPTDEAVQLDATQSYVVDPAGETHPLPPRTIAPHGFATLTIPPIRPLYRIGSHTYSGGRPRYANGTSQPAYVVLDDSLGYYWDWPGSGDIRLVLIYWRDKQVFENQFVLVRRKL